MPSTLATHPFALALLLLLGSTAALPATRARAYCRADVETMANGECMESPGVPRLHWTRSCSTYAFTAQLFERISLLDESQVRASFDDSFGSWAAVGCDREPFLTQQAEALSEDEGAAFEWDIVNTSTIAAHGAEGWAEQEYASEVVALTTIFHDPDTGEIFDVDMELNGGAGAFTNCAGRCEFGRIDLRNTITHEAGHYLGLGHSPVPGATMAKYAFDGREIEKATLEEDDRAGYCALELPPHECSAGGCSCPTAPIYPSGKKARESSDCATSAPHGREGTLAWSALIAGAMLASRQRWRRPRDSRQLR